MLLCSRARGSSPLLSIRQNDPAVRVKVGILIMALSLPTSCQAVISMTRMPSRSVSGQATAFRPGEGRLESDAVVAIACFAS